MLRISLQSLFFDTGKLVSALCSVTNSATLALVQIALYQGFQQTSSALVTRAGGDLWVMARGTRVFDNVQAMSSGTRSFVASQPCVKSVRGLVTGWAQVGAGSISEQATQVHAVDPQADLLLPWSLAEGLPSDLAGPMQVSVDVLDLDKLAIHGPPLHASMSVGGRVAYVAAITRGIQSFTLAPQMFTNIVTARRILNLAEGQAHYWLVDLEGADCAAATKLSIERQPDLLVRSRQEFAKITQDFWVGGSGAGAVLAFGALLGLIVGCVIVAQTLYSLTRDRLPELATLKALGARNDEVVSFVLWQSAFLALVGVVTAVALAHLVARVGAQAGLAVVLSPQVLLIGVSSIVGMCAAASVASVRAVLGVDAAEVFK